MQHEGDSISPALYSEVDEQEERVEELFPDDNFVDVLKGLIESKQEEPISPEDLAWVDSCLVTDLDLPMESWVSLKEALLDSITSFATSYEENNPACAEEDEAGNGKHMELGVEQEIFNDRDNNAHMQADGIDEEEAANDKLMELGEEQEIVNGGGDTNHIRAKVSGVGGDHDSDDYREGKTLGSEKEFESRESIFKVWDLRDEEDDELIPELHRAVADLGVVEKEEDQFITELNKAVAESIIKEKQRFPTDEAAIADNRKLDELISSMTDLSIKPLSP